jgi:hypothetical protein
MGQHSWKPLIVEHERSRRECVTCCVQRAPRRGRCAIGLLWRNYIVNNVSGFDRYTEERYKRLEFGKQKDFGGRMMLGNQSLGM